MEVPWEIEQVALQVEWADFSTNLQTFLGILWLCELLSRVSIYTQWHQECLLPHVLHATCSGFYEVVETIYVPIFQQSLVSFALHLVAMASQVDNLLLDDMVRFFGICLGKKLEDPEWPCP